MSFVEFMIFVLFIINYVLFVMWQGQDDGSLNYCNLIVIMWLGALLYIIRGFQKTEIKHYAVESFAREQDRGRTSKDLRFVAALLFIIYKHNFCLYTLLYILECVQLETWAWSPTPIYTIEQKSYIRPTYAIQTIFTVV